MPELVTIWDTVPVGGAIQNVQMLSAGSGYTEADVTVQSETGQGAVLQAVISDGGVTGVAMTALGQGYTTATAVVNSDTGTGAQVTPIFQPAGRITRVNVINGGAGYNETSRTDLAAMVQINTTTGSGAIIIPAISPIPYPGAPGQVGSINVTAPGSGYSTATATIVSGNGGQGAVLTPVLSPLGQVTAVDVTAPGSGYTTATAGITSATGTGAELTPVISQVGSIVGFNITDGGSGLDPAAFGVVINSQTGTGAVLTPVITNGVLTAITVDDPGQGYTVSDQVKFTGSPAGGGSWPQVFRSLADAAGEIIGVKVTSPGSGYAATDTVAITGDGTGATASLTTGGGEITAITVTNPGNSNYAPTDVVQIAGDGAGAAAVINSVGGSIIGFQVADPGTGYAQSDTVTINGNGNGATANLTVGLGNITGMTVDASGSGYHPAGTVAGVTVTARGLGYTQEGTQAGINSSTGFGAILAPVVENGVITAINVADPGNGYTAGDTVMINGDGSGATATLQLGGDTITITGDGTGAEATPVVRAMGTILGINVLQAGQGYTALDGVNITGDGTGAAATLFASGGAAEIRMPYIRAVQTLAHRNPIGRYVNALAPDRPRLSSRVPAGVTPDPARSGLNAIVMMGIAALAFVASLALQTDRAEAANVIMCTSGSGGINWPPNLGGTYSPDANRCVPASVEDVPILRAAGWYEPGDTRTMTLVVDGSNLQRSCKIDPVSKLQSCLPVTTYHIGDLPPGGLISRIVIESFPGSASGNGNLVMGTSATGTEILSSDQQGNGGCDAVSCLRVLPAGTAFFGSAKTTPVFVGAAVPNNASSWTGRTEVLVRWTYY